MNVFVFDTELNNIGIIDAYTSLIWTTRYIKNGDFELYLPAGEQALDMLRDDFYLCRADDVIVTESGVRYKHVMIIKKIQITTDTENGNYLIVSGPCLKSILGRRIVWNQTTISGYVENGIRRLITENIISPSLEHRKIENFELAEASGLSATTKTQFTGTNLQTAVEKLCDKFGYGYDVDIVDGKFSFYLYSGKDRSYAQTENPYVVFSPEFENLISTEYVRDTEEYKNAALIAGEGEGNSRIKQEVGTSSGMNRYELYIDARDLSTNDEEYTEEEYAEMLINRAEESLSEYQYKESFDGEAETGYTYELGKDYFMGDIVQVQNEYGMMASARILEIIESDGENGHTIIPTFGSLEV